MNTEIKTNLWDYTDTPLPYKTKESQKPKYTDLKITEKTTYAEWLKKWKSVCQINNKKTTTIFLQKTINILKEKELAILYNHDIELFNRNITLNSIRNIKKYYSKVQIDKYNKNNIRITITETIIRPDNGTVILQILVQHILRSIINLQNNQAENFQKASKILNKVFPFTIPVRIKDIKENPIRYNYEVYCPVCGYVRKGYMRWDEGINKYTDYYHNCKENRELHQNYSIRSNTQKTMLTAKIIKFPRK